MLTDQIATWGVAEFRDPASAEAICAAEDRLGAPLPDEIRELLRETDGIQGEHGLALLWPVERISDDNARFRADPELADLYLPFEGLVFFADAGNGDQFAVSLRGAQDVFVWNHEDDSRTWVASSVMNYLKRWMTGELEI